MLPNGLPVAAPFDESFLEFLPTFFTRLERFSWSHLWFVAYLFTLTLVYLPVFAWWLRRRDRVTAAPAWATYLPLVPLVLIQLTMRERWPGISNLYDDWANVAYYSVYLLGGFVLASQPALEARVDREWPRSFAIGAGATVLLLLGVLGDVPSPAVLLAGSAVAGCCFVVAFLGIARRVAVTTSPVLEYLSESAFPVYVLHQSAIVLPGWFVVQLDAGIATKFILLLAIAVVLTLSTYHWLVRPFAIPRRLLGTKPATAHARAERVPPSSMRFPLTPRMPWR